MTHNLALNFDNTNNLCITAAARKEFVDFLESAPRVVDLSSSHPVAFMAIAQGYGSKSRRRRAVRLIMQGRPLRDVCNCLGIPFCLKRFPTDAYPAHLAFFDWPPGIDRRLINVLPKDDNTSSQWMDHVFFAARAVSSDFGLWVGKHFPSFYAVGVRPSDLLPIALFAWHAKRRSRQISKQRKVVWSRKMGFLQALHRTRDWLYDAQLQAGLEAQAVSVEGFEFVELRTLSCLSDEASAMNNCIESRRRYLTQDHVRLFGIRQSGKRVATLQIQQVQKADWYISELKGPDNCPVSVTVMQAAHDWLGRLDIFDRPGSMSISPEDKSRAWTKLLRPYREDREQTEKWVPTVTGETLWCAFDRLHQSYATQNNMEIPKSSCLRRRRMAQRSELNCSDLD